MECLAVFLVAALAVLAIVAVALQAQGRADRWNGVFRELAKRYSGACQPAGWFGRPSVRFRYGATHALVTTHSSGGLTFTQALISWPDHEFRLEVTPQQGGPNHFLGPAVFRGMEEVVLHGVEFDERYLVRSNHPAAAREFLSEGVQWQIEKLRHFYRNDDVYISIHRGRILIKKPIIIPHIEDLVEFTQMALALYDQGMLTRSVGIDFMNNGDAQLIQDAICRICGEEISTDMVFCRRCKTPHHLECWQYNGACSTYGCRETRFVAPRIANPQVEEDE